ncbi:hypothetical protein D3C80_818450 [compost metagenome]
MHPEQHNDFYVSEYLHHVPYHESQPGNYCLLLSASPEGYKHNPDLEPYLLPIPCVPMDRANNNNTVHPYPISLRHGKSE